MIPSLGLMILLGCLMPMVPWVDKVLKDKASKLRRISWGCAIGQGKPVGQGARLDKVINQERQGAKECKEVLWKALDSSFTHFSS